MKTPVALLSIILLSCSVYAQDLKIKLWPNGIPGSKVDTSYKETTIYTDNNKPRVAKVTDPEILIYFPDKKVANGTAVIICPGGSYSRLAIDHEGWDVAKWLNSYGVVGIVLKYRLPSDRIMENKTIGPLQDVQEAIRTVRRHSSEWGIKPNRIGIMGFSAGGHLAGTASTLCNEKVYPLTDSTSARPDFSLLIYGVLSMQDFTHKGSRVNLLGENPSQELIDRFSNELNVNAKTPPAFIVHCQDDKAVPIENSIRYYQALTKYHIPAELHIYEQGGHGYGLATDRKSTESTWPDACISWLKLHGWL